jgi:hypothetical protein
LNRAIVLASSAIALAFLVRLSTVAIEQLGFPYDLVFEGPNLTSIELVRAGQNPYDPAIYAAPCASRSPSTTPAASPGGLHASRSFRGCWC